MTRRRSETVYDESYAAIYDTIYRTERHVRDIARLAPVLARMAPSYRILDVGCGTGTLCGRLRDKHPRVEGLDLSPGMLEVARRKTPELTFTEGDMLDSDLYAPATFALAISQWDVVNYLETVDEYRTALANFRRWLRPGGWLCLEMLVDLGEPGEGPNAFASTLVDSERLRVDGAWDTRDSTRYVFRERIVNPKVERRTIHELFLLRLPLVYRLLKDAGFAVRENVGDEINPFLCCEAVRRARSWRRGGRR